MPVLEGFAITTLVIAAGSAGFSRALGAVLSIGDRRHVVAQPAASQADDKVTAPRLFAAVCDCPKCGKSDVHWMRPPLPKPRRGPARVIQDGNRQLEVHRWDGMTGTDESMYGTIRICTDCGNEWGQI
jgi:hypothetical protein